MISFEAQQKIDKLVTELKHLYDERLVSVCVYGSAVFENQAPRSRTRHHNINVLVILRDLTRTDLEKASSISKWWERVAHSLPLFFSRQEWEQSADIFALEYADIRDTHQVVYGEDLFSGVEVDRESLRLVCELELSRKLIFLRQRMLIHRDQPKQLLEMLDKNINSFAAIFRGILRVENPSEPVPQKALDVFDALSRQVEDFDPTPFQQVYRHKTQNARLNESDIFNLFHQFIQQVGRVVTHVDQCLALTVQKGGVSS